MSYAIGFNETRLLKLLQSLNTSHEPVVALREISRMRIPEGIAKNCRVLELVEPHAIDSETRDLVDIIKRKYLKAVDTNRLRREKAALAKQIKLKKCDEAPSSCQNEYLLAAAAPLVPGAENILSYQGMMYPPQPSAFLDTLATPLQIEIPSGTCDNTFHSNDLLAQKLPLPNPALVFQSIEQLIALNETEPMAPEDDIEHPLKFGPGLQQSVPSAFRPFVAKPKAFTLEDLYNSPVFQEAYRKVVEEDEARRSMPNPPIDHILDEMNMLNAPLYMLQSRRYLQQQKQQEQLQQTSTTNNANLN